MGARIAMMRLGRKTEGITCRVLDFTKDHTDPRAAGASNRGLNAPDRRASQGAGDHAS
ncbi:hypothetical protein SAMN06295905_0668 [Devosia lucknowensis]|uniref:Uncharacterized protein n=1 Tax=Devosia lucknowensis TaxID=1096929 RepID=A0A1Y6EIM4_9HYPH|nr:hypothetical protein SAMN06295905_0668 [Devosia lucknowensis]